MSDLKTLSVVLKEYLRNATDRTERNLLRRFNQFMDGNHWGIKIKEVRQQHFESFLGSLSLPEKSLKSYASRLKRFGRHIGLSEKVVRPRKPFLGKDNEAIRSRYEKKLAEKDDVIARHRDTIKEMDRIIDTLKSKKMQIREIENLEKKKAELDKQIAENEMTIERQAIVKVKCPTKGFAVSFGNDCHECLDFLICPAYGKLVNPED